MAKGRAVYLETLIVEDLDDVLWQAPIRAVYFLFTPLAWWIHTLEDALAFLDAALYLLMIVVILRHWRSIGRDKGFVTVLLATLLLVIGLGLVTSYYGSAIRHRQKVAPLIIALAGVSMAQAATNSEPRHIERLAV